MTSEKPSRAIVASHATCCSSGSRWEQLSSDILLLGRFTYESFYSAWPLREGPMAEKISTMRKAVCSCTLGSSD